MGSSGLRVGARSSSKGFESTALGAGGGTELRVGFGGGLGGENISKPALGCERSGAGADKTLVSGIGGRG